MSQHLFIEPADVLILRANQLFGDAGSYGQTQVLPWPSVMAGALRSALLAHDGWDLQAFASGERPHPAIGTPQQPGAFRLLDLSLARREESGTINPLRPLPADMFVPSSNAAQPTERLWRLQPQAPAEDIETSAPTAQIAILKRDETSKPAAGVWLTDAGWRAYLAGQKPRPEDLVVAADLWATEARIGVALDAERGAARDGALFTTQAVAFRAGTGFLAALEGAELASSGTLRLGGDGRAAHYRRIDGMAGTLDSAAICHNRCCRLILTTPGLFDQGWLPPGMNKNNDGYFRFDLHGVRGRLVSAAVPRADVISGWNLAAARPKPAQRAAPTGSVYWLDQLEADEASLRKLADQGLWPEHGYDAQRRAEGFNRIAIAAY